MRGGVFLSVDEWRLRSLGAGQLQEAKFRHEFKVLHVSGHKNILIAGERSRERIGGRKVVLGFEARRTGGVVGSHAEERNRRATQCFSDHTFCLADTDPLDQRVLNFAPIHH